MPTQPCPRTSVLRRRALHRGARLSSRTCYYLFDFGCSSHWEAYGREAE